MDVTGIRDRVDEVAGRWGHHVLRWAAALLWLSNASWKVPPDFGRSARGCRQLCGYVAAGAEHPVLPGSAWVFEHVVSPNLGAFGWITLLSEVALAALLLSGRLTRSAAVLGIVQSFGILVAVANADHEWYWSYVLMIALHVALLATVRGAVAPSLRTVAGITAVYGVIVAAAHAGAGFGGDRNRDWSLFAQRNDLPGDFGRNVFPGSIALGTILVVIALGTIVLHGRLDTPRQQRVGWAALAVAFAALLTYGSDGLVIGLGSRASTVAVVAALALTLAVPGRGISASRA